MKKVIFYVMFVLLLCMNVLGQDGALNGESFEVLKTKDIAHSKARYQVFSKPFEKCMESTKPLEKDSLIYKMFYDLQTNRTATGMIIKYIQNDKNPLAKRQELFNFLLKSMNPKNPDIIRKRPNLTCFSDKKYYNEESRRIVNDLLLKEGCSGRELFLIDIAEIYNDPEISEFLKVKAAKCEEWKSDTEWFALLILARHGDKEAIKKVMTIAKKPVQKDRRSWQVWDMPLQLAYVPQQEIVDLLKEFLYSKESYWNGEDAIPQAASLSHSSAMALSNIIKDYPQINARKYSDADRQKCIEWLNTNKNYEMNINNTWSYNIRNALLGL